MDVNIQKFILNAQKIEITEYYIYKKLSRVVKDPHNREVLNRIADDELMHYNYWKSHTNRDIQPSKILIWFYYFIARVFGLTFGVRLMELGEERAIKSYSEIVKIIPEAQDIIDDEQKHEDELLKMLDEELLDYIGSVVLGLNDALVELTGALAGLTLAFNNTAVIAVAGLITGVAASMSMGASEYLATKSEEESNKNPLKAAIYTGFAYILTVIFLIAPYLIFNNLDPITCLIIALLNAVIIVFLFTFYISVAKSLPFKKRFLEIIGISMGIAALSFIFGLIVNSFIPIEI